MVGAGWALLCALQTRTDTPCALQHTCLRTGRAAATFAFFSCLATCPFANANGHVAMCFGECKVGAGWGLESVSYAHLTHIDNPYLSGITCLLSGENTIACVPATRLA